MPVTGSGKGPFLSTRDQKYCRTSASLGLCFKATLWEPSVSPGFGSPPTTNGSTQIRFPDCLTPFKGIPPMKSKLLQKKSYGRNQSREVVDDRKRTKFPT